MFIVAPPGLQIPLVIRYGERPHALGRHLDSTELNAPEGLTVYRHLRLIEKVGSSWWGWLRSKAEPDCTEPLQRRLNRFPVEIGLWSRKEERYFIATCAELYVCGGLPHRSPDLSLTPADYQEDECPAWFKLTKIRQLPDQAELVLRFGPGLMRSTDNTILWADIESLDSAWQRAGSAIKLDEEF
jgi:hypothetical protein